MARPVRKYDPPYRFWVYWGAFSTLDRPRKTSNGGDTGGVEKILGFNNYLTMCWTETAVV